MRAEVCDEKYLAVVTAKELLVPLFLGPSAIQKKRSYDGETRETDSITVAERRDNWDQD